MIMKQFRVNILGDLDYENFLVDTIPLSGHELLKSQGQDMQ